MSSSTCCSQFLRGRPGGRFQSAAGVVPVWASIDSCSACEAGVFSGRRQMWPNNEWTSRDQKWKSCIGQTPSSTERISCFILFLFFCSFGIFYVCVCNIFALSAYCLPLCVILFMGLAAWSKLIFDFIWFGYSTRLSKCRRCNVCHYDAPYGM